MCYCTALVFLSTNSKIDECSTNFTKIRNKIVTDERQVCCHFLKVLCNNNYFAMSIKLLTEK